MRFAPCIVVPVYNHGASVGATVRQLAAHGLPVYLVDDGSAADTAAVLDQLAASDTCVRLIRRPRNGGKGAAVMDGLRAAWSDGNTHALQVDADGQHALDDVARFLETSRQAPDCIVCGVPRYDASVPKGRLYGRYATHVWVWIETLSFEIKDSMCGFRVYPLAPTQKLLQDVRLGSRMDFDTEILVRLFWRGLRLINLETHVTYPSDGVSHFRMWRDNIRISWMHTRLAIGMLWRIPMLLLRKLDRQQA